MKPIQMMKIKTKNMIDSITFAVLKVDEPGSEMAGWIKKSRAENIMFWNVICIKSMRIRDILRI